jgi:hypothetical protein
MKAATTRKLLLESPCFTQKENKAIEEKKTF